MVSSQLSPVVNNTEPSHSGPLSKDLRKSKPDPIKFDPISALKEFAFITASITTTSGERDRLKKRSQAEATALRRATDRNFKYPSIAKRLKTGKEQLDSELARVDEKLRSYEKMQDHLIKLLASNFNSAQQWAESQLKLEDVKRDLNQATADIEQRINSTNIELKNVKDELIAKHSDQQNSLGSIITDKVKSMGLEILEKQQQHMDSYICTIADERKQTELSVKTREEDFSNRLEIVGRKISEQQRLCSVLGEKWDSMRVTNNGTTIGTVAEIMGQVQNLRHVQEAKDEAIADELDKFESKVASMENELAKLKQMVGSNTQPSSVTVPAVKAEIEEIQQTLQGVNQFLENQSQLQQAHQTALHSLETRYNHLSTEPIVQHMVAAMQEMYPHASSVQQEIVSIKETTNKLITTINSIRGEIRTAENARTALVTDMTAERDRMTHEIGYLRSRTDALSHENLLSKVDDVEKRLRSRLDDVENVVANKLAAVLTRYEQLPTSQNS
ncbi:hypothetical protein PAAG_08116 [Paracoccidioides lutzii Pb01]|uniref:Paramyosin n=1 Tax=Paracoccidioides lutzii (strain ATCC MYA-826 / Pb01) TaxID=502779 RepID=C1HBH5_PARBA|nr:hypothetical protein PAAG_08116 [Paracoccidioides lutzii Pb01]EEH37698.1 hypothetical protein PAAG_08116 [Paracoccidioides lutzii Pb01]